MYERFTDRARKVMQLANLEAQRCNHEYIDTSHVLLAIIKDGGGVAARALGQLGVNLEELKLQTTSKMNKGPERFIVGTLPSSERVKAMIAGAEAEVEHEKCFGLGTEHLLIGMLIQEAGAAVDALSVCGVTTEDFRGQVAKMAGDGSDWQSVEEHRNSMMAWVARAATSSIAVHDSCRIKDTLRSEIQDYESAGKRLAEHARLLHGVFTVDTEAGELLDAFKKTCFYGSDLDLTNIKEECGDVLWGIQLICDAMGWTIDEVIQLNIEKLKARYPEKWAQHEAMNRDLEAEREVLESGE